MRTITFLFFMTIAIAVSATRIHNVTVAGKTPSVPFARFLPTNNSETAIGHVQMIFPAVTDLSNVNVTLSVTSGSVVEPDPLPTDWSSTVTGIKVTNVDGVTWAKHKITLKVLNPAPLPLEIETGPNSVFWSSDWTPATSGWAAACIDNNSEYIRFGGSGKASFVVAFTDIPDSLIYTLKVLHTEWNPNNIFDVDGSADGINWTSIKRYDATVAMPIASPTIIVRLEIAPEYRYVRWHYTHRAASNVLLENILVTKGVAETGILLPVDHKVKLFNTGNVLQLVNTDQVSRLRVYSVTGSLVMDIPNPSSTINTESLNKGIYISELRLKDNSVFSARFMK